MERLPVEYRPEAVADIEAVFLYVLKASGSFGTASNFTDRIFERCESIGNVPRAALGVPISAKASVSYPSKEVQ